jgi:hypothetical protein
MTGQQCQKYCRSLLSEYECPGEVERSGREIGRNAQDEGAAGIHAAYLKVCGSSRIQVETVA